jgi:hypothetical protein
VQDTLRGRNCIADLLGRLLLFARFLEIVKGVSVFAHHFRDLPTGLEFQVAVAKKQFPESRQKTYYPSARIRHAFRNRGCGRLARVRRQRWPKSLAGTGRSTIAQTVSPLKQLRPP